MDVKTFGGHWHSVLVIRGAIALSSFVRCQQCYLRHVYVTVQYIQPVTVRIRSSLSESMNFWSRVWRIELRRWNARFRLCFKFPRLSVSRSVICVLSQITKQKPGLSPVDKGGRGERRLVFFVWNNIRSYYSGIRCMHTRSKTTCDVRVCVREKVETSSLSALCRTRMLKN